MSRVGLTPIPCPYYEPGWEQDEGDPDTVDLAVVQLETPVEGVTPFKLYDCFDELGLPIPEPRTLNLA